jgi:hypothetical protein
MSQVEFETTIPVFKRTKTVHALDLTATAIGDMKTYKPYSELRIQFVAPNYL